MNYQVKVWITARQKQLEGTWYTFRAEGDGLGTDITIFVPIETENPDSEAWRRLQIATAAISAQAGP